MTLLIGYREPAADENSALALLAGALVVTLRTCYGALQIVVLLLLLLLAQAYEY